LTRWLNQPLMMPGRMEPVAQGLKMPALRWNLLPCLAKNLLTRVWRFLRSRLIPRFPLAQYSLRPPQRD
jgi:hypothetical protein